ncbi:MAG: hypothetical protein H6626_05675 [Pseudobdellovibrionaceae bacterium]|nr:MAG: hypothetical protein H6626_05675 [Pseudobdellovibrionaceae bacterium]
MSVNRNQIFLGILTCSLLMACGPTFDKPIAPDFSPKEKTTVTTAEETPKLTGEWEGYCHDYFTGKPSDKITRLVFGQRCGKSYMSLEQESKSLTFEFSKEFFEYYVSEEVQSCPANAEHCDCYEHDDGKKECTQFSVGRGECTLKVTATVQDTILVERNTLLGDSSNRYLRLANLKSELVYLSSEVENTELPKDKKLPYDFYSNLEKAKANCESFAGVWKNKKEPVHLVYRLGEDAKSLIFPGKESSPLSFSLLDSPMMAFKK